MNEDYEKIKDFILLMLGAPVVDVELSDERLDKCIKDAEEFVEHYVSKTIKKADKDRKLYFIQEGALLKATFLMLVDKNLEKTELGSAFSKVDEVAKWRDNASDWRQQVREFYTIDEDTVLRITEAIIGIKEEYSLDGEELAKSVKDILIGLNQEGLI